MNNKVINDLCGCHMLKWESRSRRRRRRRRKEDLITSLLGASPLGIWSLNQSCQLLFITKLRAPLTGALLDEQPS